MKLEFTTEEREFIYEKAYKMFTRNQMRVRGQAITEQDGMDYWVHHCTVEAVKCPTVFFEKIKVIKDV